MAPAPEHALHPEDDEIEIELRPAVEVANRLVALAAVARRAFLERGLPEDEDWDESEDDPDDRPDDAATERYDLAAWLRDEGIDGCMTVFERAIVDAPVGALDPESVALASWAGEALVALAWGAGLVSALPPFDRPADLGVALAAIPRPWDKTGPFRSGTRLRSDEDAAAGREQADLWRWRVGVEGVIRRATAAEGRELRAIVRETAREAAAAGLLPDLANGDFAASGRSVSALPDPALDDLAAIATERLRALNWLCGFGASWDDVPLDL